MGSRRPKGRVQESDRRTLWEKCRMRSAGSTALDFASTLRHWLGTSATALSVTTTWDVPTVPGNDGDAVHEYAAELAIRYSRAHQRPHRVRSRSLSSSVTIESGPSVPGTAW